MKHLISHIAKNKHKNLVISTVSIKKLVEIMADAIVNNEDFEADWEEFLDNRRYKKEDDEVKLNRKQKAQLRKKALKRSVRLK